MAKRKENVKLKRLEHYILNTLADGSEPVSMIYNDIFDYKLGWNKSVILKTVSDLLDRGLLKQCNYDRRTKVDYETLSKHYDGLEVEIASSSSPFFYSKGEYYLEMSEAGRKEWEKEKYLSFYDFTKTKS